MTPMQAISGVIFVALMYVLVRWHVAEARRRKRAEQSRIAAQRLESYTRPVTTWQYPTLPDPEPRPLAKIDRERKDADIWTSIAGLSSHRNVTDMAEWVAIRPVRDGAGRDGEVRS